MFLEVKHPCLMVLLLGSWSIDLTSYIWKIYVTHISIVVEQNSDKLIICKNANIDIHLKRLIR